MKQFFNEILSRTTGYVLSRANKKTACQSLFESPVIQKAGIREVWDVGANDGHFYQAVELLFPKGTRFKLFEPIPALAAKLERNFSSTHVTVYPIAFSEKDGIESFYESEFSPTSSLLKPLESQTAHYPGTVEHMRSVEIQTIRIESFIQALDDEIHGPRLLKIDVQGAELKLLKGAGSSLQSFAMIYCECALISCYHGQPLVDEIVHFLSLQGFRVAGFGDVVAGISGVFTQVDVLFIRNDYGDRLTKKMLQ